MTRLWKHQQDAISWALDRYQAILNHGMGCGKSRTTLEIIKRLSASKVLVCCPVAVIPAWCKQVGLWIPDVRVVALTKGTAKQKDEVVQAALADTTPVIVVVNYETAWRMKSLERVRWDVLVWDEVHRLKAPSGAASRWAGRVCKANPQARKIALSGTLIPHSVLDLWAIYRAVESPDCPTFGTSFTLHRAKYAVMSNGLQKFVVGYRNLDDAHRRLAATTHQAKSADVLDLPPILVQDVAVDLTPAEARVYREIETDFCAVVENGTITPANALVQLLRLQQVCGGAVRYDGDTVSKNLVDVPAKAAALADMLEDLPPDEPVVVFCRFSSDIANVRAVADRLGVTVSELSGHARQLDDWQQGKTRLLVTQIQSGGIGIDLTRASVAWFYSLGYSLSEYEQAVARLHRPGQTKHTHIYHLIATHNGRATVDGRVHEALRDRKEVVDVIIDGLRDRTRCTAAAQDAGRDPRDRRQDRREVGGSRLTQGADRKSVV